MADVGLRKVINGPEAFTPDNEFCLGETEVDGFFVAAGFCAHGIAGAGGIGKVMAEWIVDGEPELGPVAHGHQPVRRGVPSPSYTLARTIENYQTYYDIAYPAHRARVRPPAADVAGLRLARRARRGLRREVRLGAGQLLRRRTRTPATRAHAAATAGPAATGRRRSRPSTVATRTTAGLFDETSFAKIEVTRAGRGELPRVGLRQPRRPRGRRDHLHPGAQPARRHRGGLHRHPARRTTGSCVVTGTAFGTHDLAWLRKQARLGGCDVTRRRRHRQSLVTSRCGDRRARDILGSLTAADLSRRGVPVHDVAGDHRRRRAGARAAGHVHRRARLGALRDTEYGAALWTRAGRGGRGRTAWCRAATGRSRRCGWRRATGSGAPTSRPETNPYEAGLGFCVKLDKPGGFVGARRAARAKAAGLTRRLCCLVLDDPRAVVLGAEPVRVDGEVVGRVTSGGLGYTSARRSPTPTCRSSTPTVGTAGHVNLFGRTCRHRHRPRTLLNVTLTIRELSRQRRLPGNSSMWSHDFRSSHRATAAASATRQSWIRDAHSPGRLSAGVGGAEGAGWPATVRTEMRIRSGRNRSRAYSTGWPDAVRAVRSISSSGRPLVDVEHARRPRRSR